MLGALLAGPPGCANKGQSVDCHEACSKLSTCAEQELDLTYCHDRCADNREGQQPLYDQLQRCTDCLDASYDCSEIADKCPICTDVSAELIEAQPGNNSGGAGGSG